MSYGSSFHFFTSDYQNTTTAAYNSSLAHQQTNVDIPFYLKEEDLVYALLTLISSSLSLIGCSGIISVFYYYKDLQTCGRRLLVYLSLADLLTAVGNIMGVVWLLCRSSNACRYIYKSMIFCKLQAALTIFSSISSFFWMIVIGLCLVASIVRNNPSFASTYMKFFHLICWPTPGIIAIITLGMNVIGYDKNIASWCWIDPRASYMLLWQFLTGKIWEITTYILTVVIYTAVRIFLWQKSKTSLVRGKKSRKVAMQEANRKLTFIPFVFIVSRIWGTLRFLLGSVAHYDKPWIAYLQGFGDSFQGFANFVLYCCLTDKIRERLISFLCIKRQQLPATMSAPTSRQIRTNSVDVSNPL